LTTHYYYAAAHYLKSCAALSQIYLAIQLNANDLFLYRLDLSAALVFSFAFFYKIVGLYYSGAEVFNGR